MMARVHRMGLVVAVLACALALASALDVDRSRASLGHPAAVGGARGGAGLRGRPGHALPSPSQAVGPTDESVTFGVNTRGELGAKRAALMCKCDVLSILIDDSEQAGTGDDEDERRSYTVPELKAKVPMVTIEYAKKNKQISFGANVRGEEGRGFNPTWCNCEVQQPPNAASASDADAENDDDDDDVAADDAKPGKRTVDGNPRAAGNPRASGAPSRMQRRGSVVGVQENLQLSEAAAPAAVRPVADHDHHMRRHRLGASVTVIGGDAETHLEGKADAPSAAQVASSNINLETGEGLAVEETAAAAPAPRRGESGATEYVYRGHRYSREGQRLVRQQKSPEGQEPAAAASTMILTELSEGTSSSDEDSAAADAATGADASSDTVAETKADDVAVSAVEDNGNETAAAAAATVAEESSAASVEEDSHEKAVEVGEGVKEEHIGDSTEAPAPATTSENEAPAATAEPTLPESISASPEPSPSPSAAADEEDSDDDDAIVILDKLRKKHPHTSEVLARALAAAATQQEAEMAQYRKALADKDEELAQLRAAKEAEEADLANLRADMQAEEKHFADELQHHEEYEKELLATATPSPSPSESAAPSASPSSSPVPTPSPSAVPIDHYAPKVNRKACNDECRVRDCQHLFETSLKLYTDCVQRCATNCYSR